MITRYSIGSGLLFGPSCVGIIEWLVNGDRRMLCANSFVRYIGHLTEVTSVFLAELIRDKHGE